MWQQLLVRNFDSVAFKNVQPFFCLFWVIVSLYKNTDHFRLIAVYPIYILKKVLMLKDE